ncbi:hypothetical protein NKG94_48200 [Micromonospora sp. M12]
MPPLPAGCRQSDQPAAYAYLLGLYLGGGRLTVAPKVLVLRIARPILESYPSEFLRGLFHSDGRRLAPGDRARQS